MLRDYALADLLMFGPEVYLRLFTRFNESVWPLQILALAVGVAIPVLMGQPARWLWRTAIALLALAWVCSAAGFLRHYYTPINWPVYYFEWAFVLEGLMLMVIAGFWQTPDRWRIHGKRGRTLAVFWFVMLVVLPWCTVQDAGDFRAVALLGLAPDVTAVGTVVLLLLVPRKLRWPLLFIPLAWCAFSSAMLWGLSLPWAMLVPMVGLATGFVALFAGNEKSAAS